MLAYKKNIHNYIVRSTHRGKGIRSKAKSDESFRRDSFLFGEFGENVDKRIDIDKRERGRKEGRKRVRDAGNVKIGTRAGSVTTAISHLSDRI